MIASISRWSNMTTAEYWELREQRLMLELAQADAYLAGRDHMRNSGLIGRTVAASPIAIAQRASECKVEDTFNADGGTALDCGRSHAHQEPAGAR